MLPFILYQVFCLISLGRILSLVKWIGGNVALEMWAIWMAVVWVFAFITTPPNNWIHRSRMTGPLILGVGRIRFDIEDNHNSSTQSAVRLLKSISSTCISELHWQQTCGVGHCFIAFSMASWGLAALHLKNVVAKTGTATKYLGIVIVLVGRRLNNPPNNVIHRTG
jgi:hypothetical protein